MLPTDFREILSGFNAAGVEYLVVGGYALAAHGEPRATGDIDLWVRATPENARRVNDALIAFGAPGDQFTAADFERPDLILQIGVPPLRIDVLTSIDGVTFEDAWPARVTIVIDGVDIAVISREHLIRSKRSTGRAQDALDARRLAGDER